MDFSVFYKKCLGQDFNWLSVEPYDLLISAYDETDRVKKIFELVPSRHKKWLLFPQYELVDNFSDNPLFFSVNDYSEDGFINSLFEEVMITSETKIAIDISGFIRPHLVYLVRYLSNLNIHKVDFLYTEPANYKYAEETQFSGFVKEVRIIAACGSHDINPKQDNDLLIIASGYDEKLVARVGSDKRSCKKKYQIIGFPSFQPDMYQDSIFRFDNAKHELGSDVTYEYAPANDPFVVATIVHEIIESNPNLTNVYLSPLSTKPQTLGFALYYVWLGIKLPVSIIFPFSGKYITDTTEGSKNTWLYSVEFPAL